MTPELREQFRLGILHVLEEHGTRFGRPVAAIEIHLRSRGFEVERKALEAEIVYLEDKQLVAEALKGVSPENRCYRITAEGRDYLATH